MEKGKGFYPIIGVAVFIVLIISFISLGSSNSFLSQISSRLTALVVNIFDETGAPGENITLVNDPALAYQSNSALKFYFPNQWHYTARLDSSAVTMKEGDTLNFYIRTASSTYTGGLTLFVNYSGSSDQSQDIDVLSYLPGRQVTDSYQLVSIPYSALGGSFSSRNMFRHFYLKVPTNQVGNVFYVDKVYLETKEVASSPTLINNDNSATTNTSQTVVASNNTGTTNTTVSNVTTPVTDNTQIVLFDDFPSNLTFSNAAAINDGKLAHTGSWLFALTPPDQWHPTAAISFNTFYPKAGENLQFYLRTKSGTYSDPLWASFRYSGSADQTQELDLLSYIVPGSQVTQAQNRQLATVSASSYRGQINTGYQLVSIPVSELKGNYQGKFRHFSLRVPKTKTPVTFYLDDLNFITNTTNQPSVTGTSATTSVATSTPVDEPVVTPKPNYTVTSESKNIFFDENDITLTNALAETGKDLAYNGDSFVRTKIPNSYHPYAQLVGPTVSFGSPGADTLSFFLRTAKGSFNKPIYLILDWQVGVNTSQPVDIRPYLKDGQLTDTWQRVMIPSSVFQDKFNGSFRLFQIRLEGADVATAPSFLIDTITLENRQGLSFKQIEILDNHHVMLLVDKAPNMDQARDPKIYSLTDSSGKSFTVEKVGFRNWIEGFVGDSANSPIIRYYIYLTLSEPLTNGQTYSLTADILNLLGGNLPAKNYISFAPDFINTVSSTIKVNQVGYLPDSPKIAYVGNYLGDGGEMPISATTGYVINEATGQTVFSGALVKAPQQDVYGGVPFTGEEVWTFDFASLQTPGQYHIYVPGIGRSYKFRIASNVYNDVFYKTNRAFMYQRSDIDLPASVAGLWARTAEPKLGSDGQPRVGYYNQSIKTKSPEMQAADEIVNGYKDFTGGWYDAADYSHYVLSAYEAVNLLLTMYEIVPDHFTDGQLNLPGNESRNGVPDYLDNVKWETDWLAKMVGSDGCAYTVLGYDHWPNTMPAQEKGKMWAITKNTIATGDIAGALAQASRIMAPYFPEAAAKYKAKALAAWSCLERFPTLYPVIADENTQDEYCDPMIEEGSSYVSTKPHVTAGCYFSYGNQKIEDLNARAIAAIELFRLTGDSKYDNAFKSLLPLTTTDTNKKTIATWIPQGYYTASANTMKAYSYYLDPKADPAWKAEIKKSILSLAKQHLKDNRWRYWTPTHSVGSVGWGGFTGGNFAYNFILAYLLSDDKNYLNDARLSLDTQLGANSLSQSFITGVGSKSPMHPISNLSDYDGVTDPVPGYQIYGPIIGLSYRGFYKTIIDYTYPPFRASTTRPDLLQYPSVRRYADSSNVTPFGEYTVNSLAATAAVYGYFYQP